MNIWLDAQLSPAMAVWISAEFPVSVVAVRDLGLREAKDREIFLAAREAGAVVMTKDRDFVRLVEELGSPPQVIWLTCGNTSNTRLREILKQTFDKTMELIEAGEPVVEINAA
jgi:predicted nuclease of predicted toxin-antitoxin system